jgi:hypothetical protein
VNWPGDAATPRGARWVGAMDDLAESVIKHLSVINGTGPCAAVCRTEQKLVSQATFCVILPVVKDGVPSFNIDFVEEETNINYRWVPHASFNVATVQEAVEGVFHWKDSMCPDKIGLLIEVGNWNGYPEPGTGGRSPNAIPGFGAKSSERFTQHASREEVEATIRMIGGWRAPVDV